ncbi:MAG: exodeoxyribonuclease VII large subunit [Rhodobacteraceae bacterium]|nr:exodeoxyribonuclease VII large subunit [Paracoccaceae bacterium]
MSDMFDDDEGNAPALSVSQLSGAVKRVVEGEFGRVRVRGEVGRVSRPASGHLYLDLKDDRAVLASVIWKGVVSKLAHPPEAGMEVIATGRLTTFPGQSRYQLVIEHIAPAGIGALMAMLEKRKAALAAEGLFDAGRKQPLPYLPEVIGVVTSPSGAVIRDILHRLRARFPRKVLIWPAVVQGEKCATEVAAAIRGFNALTPGGALPRPDVLIVARGGGSLEDLWGFNEEVVVRAVAESTIPVITAIGHETDTTLVDYAADQRAPTPSAAAEMVVPVRADLLAALAAYEARRVTAMARRLQSGGQRLRDLGRALPRPETILGERSQRLDGLVLRLPAALLGYVRKKHLQLSRLALHPVMLARDVQNKRARLERLGPRLPRALSGLAKQKRLLLARVRPRPALLQREIGHLGQRRQAVSLRFAAVAAQQAGAWRQRLDGLVRMHRGLGYKNTLARGYAVVRGDGKVVTGRIAAQKADALEIEFSDGKLAIGKASTGKNPKRKPRKGADENGGGAQGPGGQGSFF